MGVLESKTMSILGSKTMSVQDLHLTMRLEKMMTMGEIRGVKKIFNGYNGEASITVSVNDKSGKLTTSVINTALRILCIAGVVQKRGLGCEGTYIKIIKPEILSAIVELEEN